MIAKDWGAMRRRGILIFCAALRWCHWHTSSRTESFILNDPESQITFQNDHLGLHPFNATYRVTSCCTHYQLLLDLNCMWTVEWDVPDSEKEESSSHKDHPIVFTSNMYKKYQLPCLIWDFPLSDVPWCLLYFWSCINQENPDNGQLSLLCIQTED